MYTKDYRGVIWTDHALSRLGDRKIKQSDAWVTFIRPDSSEYSKKKGVWVYNKTFDHMEIRVAAKKNNQGKWLIISVWATKKDRPQIFDLMKYLKNLF
jgi:hypothetical protein